MRKKASSFHLKKSRVATEIERAREENMRLRRVQGELMVKLSEAIAEQMILRAQLEGVMQELEKLRAAKH